MFNFLLKFLGDEDGAVTVDFVVLTASIVVLGLAVGIAVGNGARGLSNDIDNSLDRQGGAVSISTTNAIDAAAG